MAFSSEARERSRPVYMRTQDGSLVDSEGKIIYFSIERFVRDIGEGNCCFICGRSPSSVEFNDEHILPDWILRDYALEGKSIHLPNGAAFEYSRYKIPCCEECNAEMGRRFENPISEIVKGGFDSLQTHIERAGTTLLFVWMTLIFLKTHLRDKHFRFNLDRRQPPDPISGLYDWESLHHAHVVARSFYTRAVLTKEVFGSFIIWPVRSDMTYDNFDYFDLYEPRTVALRLGNIGLLAVLNDACAAINISEPLLDRLGNPLSEIQFRELMARLAYVNLQLKSRPVFRSSLNENGDYRIEAVLPTTCEIVHDKAKLGRIMSAVLGTFLPSITPRHGDRDQFLSALNSGDATFLFDEHGKFSSAPAERVPEAK